MKHKWVFSNISIDNLNPFLDLLTERIENSGYSFKDSYKQYCYRVLKYLEFYSTLCSLNTDFSQKFKIVLNNNINKIVAIHGADLYLQKLNTLWKSPASFINYDELDYHTLFDCLRYGNYNMVTWYIDNILDDCDDFYKGVHNVFNTNNGLSFIFNNYDWRI